MNMHMEIEFCGKTALHCTIVKARPEFHRPASTYEYTHKTYEYV